jgi:hypothetical protein
MASDAVHRRLGAFESMCTECVMIDEPGISNNVTSEMRCSTAS